MSTETEIERFSTLPRPVAPVVTAVAVAMSLFHIWALGFTVMAPWVLTAFHVMFGTVLGFALFPALSRPGRWRTLTGAIDVVAIAAAIACYGYVLIEMDALLQRAGFFPEPLDVVFGLIAVALTLELTRRTTGWALPIVAIASLLYAYFGDLIPGMLGHRGYGAPRILSFVFSLDGIFSTPLQVSATYIFLFVLFGAFLQTSGAGQFFLDLASSMVGWIRGGPAKIAIFASALFGTISGSAVANTAGTGAVTIPLMKRVGYKPAFAAAVEAVASTGGQIMPPIMGAGAFIIADIVGVSYWTVAIAAIIPALLYFATVLISVDIEAVKTGLKGVPRDELAPAMTVMRAGGHLLIPVLVLLLSLAVFQTSPIRAALYAIAAMVVVSWLRRHTRMGPAKLIEALASGAKNTLEVIAACATAGIVVGVLNLTGLGQIVASVIVELSHGIVFLALVLSMGVCILLGMGLPTTPAYIIAASVVAPALVQLGVPALPAHLFIFYFACIAVITPPVALASYTAAGIARANPSTVGFVGVKLGVAAFLIPFMFVYSPALIAQAPLVTTALAVITALVGVYALASAIQGWFLGRLPLAGSLVLLAAAFTLIRPGLWTDLAGIGLVGAVGAWQILRHRATAPAPAARGDAP